MSKPTYQEAYQLNKLLYLDSRDRQYESDGITLQPVSDFTFRNRIQETNIEYFAVQQCSFSQRFITINEYNNKIKINGVSYTIVQGAYINQTDLCNAVNSAIAASGVTCTINITPGSERRALFSGGAPFTVEPGDFVNGTPQGKYQLFDMLGFTKNILSGASSYLSVNEINIFPTRYIDICSTRLSQYRSCDLSTDLSLKNGVFRLTIDNVSLYETIIYENKILYKYKFEPSEQIGLLDMQLFDEYNQKLTYTLADFTLTLFLFSKTKDMKTFVI